jgi:hypothetical protein
MRRIRIQADRGVFVVDRHYAAGEVAEVPDPIAGRVVAQGLAQFLVAVAVEVPTEPERAVEPRARAERAVSRAK